MEFWVGLYGMQSPRTHPRSFAEMYAEVLEHAAEAERLGFDGFGLTEHHFWYDGYCPSLLPVLGAIARRTRRIKLVPGALLLPLHDPLEVAAEAAAVDHLSRGRLNLALGYGYRPEEYEGFGIEKKARGARISEAVEVLRRAFAGERLSFRGRFHSYDGVAVSARPFQTPHPPMWLAGGSQTATARRAGRLGLHYWVPGVALPLARVAELIAEYRQAAREAGAAAEGLKIAVATDVAIAESREEAERIVAEDVLPVYAEQLVGFGFIRDAEGRPLRELPADHPIFQVLVESFVTGTPDDVIAGIERYRALGCDVFMPRLVEANFRGPRILEEMRLFAEQVAPHFRKGGRP
jgi:alkanesulfonate monooxygenase SsuD/methylene tetrahydromethanopterin reductase-like flavin-dependent oxidoreductase (luciferase family)